MVVCFGYVFTKHKAGPGRTGNQSVGQPRRGMHSCVRILREYRGYSIWKQQDLQGFWTTTLRSACLLMNILFPSTRSPWICRINVSLGLHLMSRNEALLVIKGKGLQHSKWTWELGLKADKHRNTEGQGKCYLASAAHTTKLFSLIVSLIYLEELKIFMRLAW